MSLTEQDYVSHNGEWELKELDSHSIGLICELCCEGDRGCGCSGMACSDDKVNERVLDSEFETHSIGLICEPSCEGTEGRIVALTLFALLVWVL